VDDATVEIENINRNLEEGKEIEQAILDGAAQIAIPAFVSTLLDLYRLRAHVLPGRCRKVSLRSAWPRPVVFAMLASYFLSRTPLCPTMAKFCWWSMTRKWRGQKRESRNPVYPVSARLRAPF